METEPQANDETVNARRRFLATCGKFAVATPPAVALMLADAERNYAVAVSGPGRKGSGNNGFGNGGGDGVPGNSGNNPSPNAGQKAADEDR